MNENEICESDLHKENKLYLIDYKQIMTEKIDSNKPIKDILLDEYFEKYKQEIDNSLKIKQLRMKIGTIWQIAIGNYIGYDDLGNCHKSGLDVIHKDRKIIMELKNRYNTDNSSSRKANFDKLVKYKNEHPEFECIYGIINDRNMKGDYKIIKHNNVEIKYYSGMCLLDYLFGEDTKQVLDIIHKIIYSYLS